MPLQMNSVFLLFFCQHFASGDTCLPVDLREAHVAGKRSFYIDTALQAPYRLLQHENIDSYNCMQRCMLYMWNVVDAWKVFTVNEYLIYCYSLFSNLNCNYSLNKKTVVTSNKYSSKEMCKSFFFQSGHLS